MIGKSGIRNLHHYHGVFAPNAPLRKWVTAYADQTLDEPKSFRVKKTADKISRASLTWAKLIARIYVDDLLLCHCGKTMKIIAFVTNPHSIKHILARIGISSVPPQLDPPGQIIEWNAGTKDGFYEEFNIYCDAEDIGPDPPCSEDYSQLILGTHDGFYCDVQP